MPSESDGDEYEYIVFVTLIATQEIGFRSGHGTSSTIEYAVRPKGTFVKPGCEPVVVATFGAFAAASADALHDDGDDQNDCGSVRRLMK